MRWEMLPWQSRWWEMHGGVHSVDSIWYYIITDGGALARGMVLWLAGVTVQNAARMPDEYVSYP